MTQKEFEEIKAAGVKKWTAGADQTEDTYEDWWGNYGRSSCLFCHVFICKYHPSNQRNTIPCPLESLKAKQGYPCSDEWNTICKLARSCLLTFELFHTNVVAFLTRIASLKYEDLKEV